MQTKSIIISILIFGSLVACANAETPTVPPATPTSTRSLPTATVKAATSTRALPTPTRVPPTATPIPPTATATPIPPTGTPAPLAELDDETLAGWGKYVEQIQGQAPDQAQASVDKFRDTLVAGQRVPLILDDGLIFLYKGQADTVTWRGDFSYWQFGAGLEGKRIGETDLWYATADFPRDSRTEYKIMLNNKEWLLDPANPKIQHSGLSANSVLTMPDFEVTDYSDRRDGVPQGTLTDWLTLDSKAWGAPLRYRVYTPPNVETLENLPVLYVTDGNDFSDEQMGGMQNALDNLIADEKIAPAMAVFIDARNAADVEDNQREIQFLARPEAFAEFITQELVPLIDEAYPTDPSRAGRVLLGVSYGGVFTTVGGLTYPEVFGNLAIFSPAYWILETPEGTGAANLAAGARRMNQAIETILPKTVEANQQKIFLSGGIPKWDVGDLESMAKRFRARGDRVRVFTSQEGHSWGAWSGLTDEMLENFFGN